MNAVVHTKYDLILQGFTKKTLPNMLYIYYAMLEYEVCNTLYCWHACDILTGDKKENSEEWILMGYSPFVPTDYI